MEDDGRVYLKKAAVASPPRAYRGYLKHLAGRDPDVLVDEMQGT